LFCVLSLMFSVSLDSTFIVLVFCVITSVLFDIVRCLVSNVVCFSGFFLHALAFTTQKTKTMKVESRETDNIRHRNRTKTNKTEVTTQKTKTMKVESRNTENIRHKTPNEYKQNRSYNTES
jgi:MFS superfamily sulfate permease-like transporter